MTTDLLLLSQEAFTEFTAWTEEQIKVIFPEDTAEKGSWISSLIVLLICRPSWISVAKTMMIARASVIWYVPTQQACIELR